MFIFEDTQLILVYCNGQTTSFIKRITHNLQIFYKKGEI